MRQIDEFFSARALDTLYHYTGIGGLLGIVKSRVVWASHAYYMNDSKEIVHACEVLKKLLTARAGALDGEEQIFVRQGADWLDTFRRNAFHIFLFALSEEPDLLSQWRSYTPHGKGVSIGFSPSVIDHILQIPGFKLAQCLYQPHEHDELMESLLEKLLTTFRQRRASADTRHRTPSEKYHSLLEEFRGSVLQVLAIVKHTGFQAEREWRIVSPYFASYKSPDVCFREGASMLLPYIELKLPRESPQVLFDEVIMGPSTEVELSHSALSAYLSNQSVCNMTRNSGIPFRMWSTR